MTKLSALQQQQRRESAIVQILRGSYDAAQTNTDNTRHWANADALSARAAHSPQVRRTLRMRCRYEVANSPLAKSVIWANADYVVGSGPRLQIITRDKEYNRAVARRFREWSIATQFPRKLHQMRTSKSVNGESFAIFITNPRVRGPVKLDLRTIEADQVANPNVDFRTPYNDGIIFDDFGNPAGYMVLKEHPGDTFFTGLLPSRFDTYSADDVIHFFDAERPGQIRGVPEIVSALPMFAIRRRYLLSVLAASETAADLAAVVHSNSTAVDPDEVEPLDAIEIERRMMLTMPKGWTVAQLKAEQPTTTIEMFDRVIVMEIGRCLRMPGNVASSHSGGMNFASAKIDLLPWWRVVSIQQDQTEDIVADPTFERWFAEASRIPGYLPPSPEERPTDVPPHKWFWDGQDLLDPREAGAKETGIRAGFDTHGAIFARKGLDVEEEWAAQAELLGLTIEQYRELIIQNVYGGGEAAGDEPESEESEEAEEVVDAAA